MANWNGLSGLLCLSFSVGTAGAAALDATTPAEQAIARAIAAGQPADLTQLPEAQRTVRAAFLERALGQTAGQGNTITIVGAEVPDALEVGERNDGIDVPMHLRLEGCHFAGRVLCSECHFHGSVTSLRCRFDRGLNLNGSTVDGDLVLREATIATSERAKTGALALGDVHVSGKLSLAGLRIDGGVAAAGLNVGSLDIGLAGSKLGLLNLARLSADTATITGAAKGGVSPATLSLAGANVHSLLRLEGLSMNRLIARQLSVSGQAMFERTAVHGLLDFSSATLNSFRWSSTAWPKTMELDGFTFKTALVTPVAKAAGKGDDDDDDWTLEFLKRAGYSQPAFQSYIDELTARGENTRADDVFFAMHHSQRRENFSVMNPATWLPTIFDCFQEYFLGYGRTVVESLLWSVVFIAMGTWLFYRGRKDMVQTDDKGPCFAPFWYSLEMFLPVVDRGIAKSWRPKEAEKGGSLLATYARVHQIAGWILIPVALAAMTAAIK